VVLPTLGTTTVEPGIYHVFAFRNVKALETVLVAVLIFCGAGHPLVFIYVFVFGTICCLVFCTVRFCGAV
jgi:hypothetical protein